MTSVSGTHKTRTDRSLTLDAVKGLLVVVMVVYHWLNYFVTGDGAVYKYLRFVTPAFIFITGFLITSGYLARYRIGDRQLHERLFVRGLKLLALFTFLNLGAHIAVHSNYDGTKLGLREFLANSFSIYVSGDGRGAVFEVLVPIGYILAGSSLLLWGCKLHRHFLLWVWVVAVGGVYFLKWKGLGSANAELVTMGLLGMVVGGFALDAIDWAARGTGVWVGSYVIYLMVLGIYDVIYELQVVGLILNVMLAYIVAKSIGERGVIARKVILLGKYSLLAYIAHIAILQVLARAMRPFDLGALASGLSFVSALLLTWLAVEATGWVRGRSPLLDRLYRLVFA